MWEVITLLILILLFSISVILLIINGIIFAIKSAKHKDKFKCTGGLKRGSICLAVIVAVTVILTLITQSICYTPKIAGDDGEKIEGSINELRKVEVNGRKEWISIRGKNKNNPVLLFLAGGPGGSQMAEERYSMPELEDYFVVVNWDQPGSCKSYNSISKSDLDKSVYTDDGCEIAKYLCNEFNQKKIYLVGESWGSALGIFMASDHPELFNAFIGTGQMVNFLETEKIDYNLALKDAEANGDEKLANKLKKNGEPPYYGMDVTWNSVDYLNHINRMMGKNSEIYNNGFNTSRDIAAPEYGMLDKVNYAWGLYSTFNSVYPKLYEIDLRESYNKLDIPVYFFLGKHDLNAPLSLSEDYYEKLNAPEKELIWFEHSAHSPWINEPDKFISELKKIRDKYN